MHQLIERDGVTEHYIDGTLRATIQPEHLADYLAGYPALAPQPTEEHANVGNVTAE